MTLALAAVALAAPAPAGAADRYRRAFKWSGYRWMVRSTEHRANPGNNRWGDSLWNARVRKDRTLRVNIAKGRSVEVVGPPTGYGRYRWVVDTALDTVDPFRVVAFFVHGTGGEQDIEFSRWGVSSSTTVGTWVTWRRSTRLGFDYFAVTPRAPYTIVIDWRVGVTRFLVRDATGKTLLDRTVVSSAPGHHVAPRVSYWLYPGNATSRSPFTSRTVHPPVIVQSFKYARRRAR